ncbi:hypothetical protein ACSN61_004229 [Escherichia coli]
MNGFRNSSRNGQVWRWQQFARKRAEHCYRRCRGRV